MAKNCHNSEIVRDNLTVPIAFSSYDARLKSEILFSKIFSSALSEM
jgi:hypothetical protein